MATKIEWCDLTINPFVGCSKCSPCCDNCYAEKMAYRLSKMKATADKYAGVVDKDGMWVAADILYFTKTQKQADGTYITYFPRVKVFNDDEESLVHVYK